jgi:PAT family beta-lactamase induction signal transducer AmpG
MWGGQILGIAGTTVGGAWMLHAFGLPATALAAALVLCLIMCVPLLVRERPGERLLPWTAGRPSEDPEYGPARGWLDIGRGLLSALILPASLVMALAFFSYRVGAGLLSALLPVMTVQELSWEDTMFAEYNASARLATGVLAMVIGGWLVQWAGRVRMLVVAGLLSAMAAVAMGLSQDLWPQRDIVITYMAVQLGLDAALSIAFFAVAMGLCRKRVAATQYALYMALSNLGLSTGSGLLGTLRESLGGYAPLFLVVAGVTLVMVAMMRFVDLAGHAARLQRLDAGPATVD